MEGRIAVIDAMPSGDMQVWNDIVNIKLDGVGFHTAMYSLCLGGGLCDMAKLHKSRAIDEYRELLCAIGVFCDSFHRPPDLSMGKPQLPPTIASEHEAVALYDDWETDTFKRLREARSALSGDKAYTSKMIRGVIDELRYIDSID